MIFEKIKNISVSAEISWVNRIFITFDIDWAHDEVLEYVIKIVDESDIKATLFCTHDTEVLNRIKKNAKLELGIHPNFNKLLEGDFEYGKNILEVINYYGKIVPDAVSVRSHSLTGNSRISHELFKNGYQFESNTFIPFNSGIELRPWRNKEDALVNVPYFWGDEFYLSLKKWDKSDNDDNIEKFLRYPGLKVFNFHPIHIYLNSESLERYDEAKKSYHDISHLKSCRNKSKNGICNFLKQLIEFGKQH